MIQPRYFVDESFSFLFRFLVCLFVCCCLLRLLAVFLFVCFLGKRVKVWKAGGFTFYTHFLFRKRARKLCRVDSVLVINQYQCRARRERDVDDSVYKHGIHWSSRAEAIWLGSRPTNILHLHPHSLCHLLLKLYINHYFLFWSGRK